MQTIRLRVNDRAYKNLVRLLSRFSREEVEVIVENDTYLSVQQYLEKELAKVEEGSAEYIDIEELDIFLEDTLKKYEA